MHRQNLPPVRQLLHPFDPAAPPTVPVRRHPLLLQILPIERPQNHIEDLGESLAHAVADEIGQVGATAPAKRPRDGRGRLVEFQVVGVLVRARFEEFDGRDPWGRGGGSGCFVVGGGDGLQLTRHHARGHADPGRQDGARGSTAVVAVVGGDHGEGDLAVGEGVQGTFGAGGHLDFVPDGATVAAAVEDQRVIWQHC